MELFRSFGDAHIAPDGRDPERTSVTEPIITSRLAAALERIDPRLSDTNITRGVKAVTQVPAAGLAEANDTLHTSLTYSIVLMTDRGGSTVRTVIETWLPTAPKGSRFLRDGAVDNGNVIPASVLMSHARGSLPEDTRYNVRCSWRLGGCFDVGVGSGQRLAVDVDGVTAPSGNR